MEVSKSLQAYLSALGKPCTFQLLKNITRLSPLLGFEEKAWYGPLPPVTASEQVIVSLWNRTGVGTSE